MTRSRCLTAWVVAAGIPAMLGAQFPGMSGMSRRLPPTLKREPGIEVPPTINIVNLVVQNRQDMVLTDTQYVRAIALKRTLDSTNAPLLRRIDSVQRLFKGRPIFSEPSPAHRDSVNAGQAVIREMTADIDDNIADAKDKLFAFLSTPQKEKAEQIEDRARKASATTGRGRL
jgi:hypothetical protein